MEQAPAENVIVADHHSREWMRLIRKLRWISLEEEAHRLELAISTVRSEERGSVLARRNNLRLGGRWRLFVAP